MGCWYDNVMVDWDATDDFIPATLKMFFSIEDEEQIYAVIHSCHSKRTKHSVLTNIWIKEYHKDSSKIIKALSPYAKNDDCSEKVPLLRIIPVEAIHSHCLLMPLSRTSQQVIQIQCTSTWADEFFVIN
jgi:hypothetical protein